MKTYLKKLLEGYSTLLNRHTIHVKDYQFNVDIFNSQHIAGWVINKSNLDQIVPLDLYASGKLITTFPANLYREDLNQANLGNGWHAFDIPVPEKVKNSKLQSYKLNISKTKHTIYKTIKRLHSDNHLRNYLSNLFIKGKGIEIGALHNPLWVSKKAHVKYVDYLSTKSLQEKYPTLKNLIRCHVDIVDDGEKLNSIKDESLDFIISNHMLEHCQNPIGTIRNHLKKLKIGGHLYYAMPNKNFTFDLDRKLTTLDHLIQDDQKGPEKSKKAHYLDWVINCEKVTDKDEIAKRLNQLLDIKYSIHYHVWDDVSFLDFLVSTKGLLKESFHIKTYTVYKKEVIAILQKVSS